VTILQNHTLDPGYVYRGGAVGIPHPDIEAGASYLVIMLAPTSQGVGLLIVGVGRGGLYSNR